MVRQTLYKGYIESCEPFEANNPSLPEQKGYVVVLGLLEVNEVVMEDGKIARVQLFTKEVVPLKTIARLVLEYGDETQYHQNN